MNGISSDHTQLLSILSKFTYLCFLLFRGIVLCGPHSFSVYVIYLYNCYIMWEDFVVLKFIIMQMLC